MNYCKAATMPAHLLDVPVQLWVELIEHLRIQGGGVRESGAFLLGYKCEGGRVVTRFLPYEQLQADALHEDYVAFTAGSFARLWELCRADGLTIVADVHTHRHGAGQSPSDRSNPMIAVAGHIAFIVPRFAQGRVHLQDLGMYVYEGSHQWVAHSGPDVQRLVRLSRDGEFK